MFHKFMESIAGEFSGSRAYQQVAAIAGFHRIQASPGFRAAADYAAGVLREAGIATEILTFPANTRTSFWSQRMFQSWHCTRAELSLLSPEKQKLADFAANPFSVIQRSRSTPRAESKRNWCW